MREPQLETIGEDRVFVQGDESRVSILSTREDGRKEKERERELAPTFLSRCERSIGEFHSCILFTRCANLVARDRENLYAKRIHGALLISVALR